MNHSGASPEFVCPFGLLLLVLPRILRRLAHLSHLGLPVVVFVLGYVKVVVAHRLRVNGGTRVLFPGTLEVGGSADLGALIGALLPRLDLFLPPLHLHQWGRQQASFLLPSATLRESGERELEFAKTLVAGEVASLAVDLWGELLLLDGLGVEGVVKVRVALEDAGGWTLA